MDAPESGRAARRRSPWARRRRCGSVRARGRDHDDRSARPLFPTGDAGGSVSRIAALCVL